MSKSQATELDVGSKNKRSLRLYRTSMEEFHKIFLCVLLLVLAMAFSCYICI